MTTTDPRQETATPPRRDALRRSRADRMGAGVASGLGRYLGLDPVLFRVLFAVAALFGGAGVIAYGLAWVLIPEEGTEHAPIDYWIAWLRAHRTPAWLVAALGGIVVWGVAFSWWVPGPFLPIAAVVIVIVALCARGVGPAPRAEPAPVDLRKHDADAAVPPAPAWQQNAKAWLEEAKRASRERRRRAFPVKVAILGSLALTLVTLGICDAAGGIVLPAYFWATGSILVLGLAVGVALGRTPWSLATLFIPVLAGLIAFGNTHSSLSDGFGSRTWAPSSASALHDGYRLAFGDATLDLRGITPLDAGRTVDVRVAAGDVEILLPPNVNATVHASVHIGVISVDGRDVSDCDGRPWCDDDSDVGWRVAHTVPAPIGAAGAPVTVNVHLAAGEIDIRHEYA